MEENVIFCVFGGLVIEKGLCVLLNELTNSFWYYYARIVQRKFGIDGLPNLFLGSTVKLFMLFMGIL